MVDINGVNIWNELITSDEIIGIEENDKNTNINYDDFITKYDAEQENDKNVLKPEKKNKINLLKNRFENIKSETKKIKVKVKKFEEINELAKKLYEVKAQIQIKVKDKNGKETQKTDVYTFIIYKGKIIYSEF